MKGEEVSQLFSICSSDNTWAPMMHSFFPAKDHYEELKKKVPADVPLTGWGNTMDAILAVYFNINGNNSKESVGADTLIFYHLNFLRS